MIREATSKLNNNMLSIYMKNVKVPCIHISPAYKGRSVKLIENWEDIKSIARKGSKIKINGAVSKMDTTIPLVKGHVLEIDDKEPIYIVHPKSSLE